MIDIPAFEMPAGRDSNQLCNPVADTTDDDNLQICRCMDAANLSSERRSNVLNL